MTLTQDGNNLVFDGTVTLLNAFNSGNGVATLVLTPSGGVGTIPGLVAGNSGEPSLFSIGTVTTLPSNQQATASITQTNPGGSGVSSEYQLNLGIPQGSTGSPGTSSTLGGSSDVSGAAVLGDTVTVSAVTGGSPTAFKYSPLLGCNWYPASSISNVSQIGQTYGTLATVTVPAQPNDWYPICFGGALCVGTTAHVFQLNALLNFVTSGQQLATVTGYATSTSINSTTAMSQQLNLYQYPGASASGALVAAGSAATIFFNVNQTAASSSAWSVSSATAGFSVLAVQTAT